MWSQEVITLLNEMQKTYDVVILLNDRGDEVGADMDVLHVADGTITHHELVTGKHTACKVMTAIRRTMRQFR